MMKPHFFDRRMWRGMPWNALVLGLWISLAAWSRAAERNVILITTDGLRWEEVFQGGDPALFTTDPGGVKETNKLAGAFLRSTPEERRMALMPFLWGTIAREGQILGNRQKGSTIKVTNGRNFSYPGYSEFLTGAPDDRIISNAKRPNPNTNVFEWIERHPPYRGKVAAVANWDTIAWILNVERCPVAIWTGLPLPPLTKNPIQVAPLITQLIEKSTPQWPEVVQDTYHHHVALDYLIRSKPKAMYVAFGETDEWAHSGRYDLYLHAAHQVDRFISTLWAQIQTMDEYRDKTTLIITTDHGRGGLPTGWKNHGAETEASGYVWAAVLGPDTPALGERANTVDFTQSQVASTVAAAIGLDYASSHPKVAPALQGVFKTPVRH